MLWSWKKSLVIKLGIKSLVIKLGIKSPVIKLGKKSLMIKLGKKSLVIKLGVKSPVIKLGIKSPVIKMGKKNQDSGSHCKTYQNTIIVSIVNYLDSYKVVYTGVSFKSDLEPIFS